MTLADGARTEAAGPFWQHEQAGSQETWGVPPLFTRVTDRDIDSTEFDFLYPLLTYDRFGMEKRLQLFQLLSLAGGQSQSATNARRLTLFPIYFQQWSAEPSNNYLAVLPFYGTIKNRLQRDQIHFALLPLYIQSRKADVVTDNYLFPIFHLRHGDGLAGWQVWPLIGREHKTPTVKTNHWGDAIQVPGHDKSFVMWPLYIHQSAGAGSTNPSDSTLIFPFYAASHSPERDSMTAPWPLGLTLTDDRARGYREWGAPWPFIVFARGSKTTSRVFPFYSKATDGTSLSQWYLWPVYKFNRVTSAPLDRQRTRILFFLGSDVIERNTETGAYARRTDVWPLFQRRRDRDGSARLQILAPVEPFIPLSKSIDRNWSPLWSLWRAESNPRAGTASQSLLWNLYRHDSTLDSQRTALLFGLYQRERDAQGARTRLFYINLGL